MSSNRHSLTLADYLVIVLSPALIMGLVGSLAFFVAEVCYAGAYSSQLRWLLFCFVFAAVLIGRISLMGEIAGRVWIYGPLLCFLVWLSLMKFVDYPGSGPSSGPRALINLGLVLIVWWCSLRLTRDCTHFDETVEVSDQGLLQAAGFEAAEQHYGIPEPEEPTTKKLGWLDRFQRYREERKKRRTPGVWVVYFCLASLPLFGLGQSLIPVEDVERRQYVFWLMAIYTGCALSLLLTTTFLGLRRYLRQRQIRMQASMAAVWLLVGGLTLASLLLLGALLPRPAAEVSLVRLPWSQTGSQKQEASRYQAHGDDPGEGPGKSGSDQKGQKKEPGSKEAGARGTDTGSQKDGEKPGGKDNKKTDQRGSGEDERGGEEGSSPESSKLDKPSAGQLGHLVEQVIAGLRKIVFLLLILVTVFCLFLGLLRYLAPFTQWAQSLLTALAQLWARLFHRASSNAESGELEDDEDAAPALPSFRAFPNPFLTGTIETMSVSDAIRYTFAAIDAWAREQGLGREPGETPLELVNRLGAHHPGFKEDLLQLADMYAHAVYAEGGLPKQLKEILRRFWDRLEEADQHASSSTGMNDLELPASS